MKAHDWDNETRAIVDLPAAKLYFRSAYWLFVYNHMMAVTPPPPMTAEEVLEIRMYIFLARSRREAAAELRESLGDSFNPEQLINLTAKMQDLHSPEEIDLMMKRELLPFVDYISRLEFK